MSLFSKKRSKFGFIYTVVSCLAIVVYAFYNQNMSINAINSSIRSAMIASGEMDEAQTSNKNTSSDYVKTYSVSDGTNKMIPLDKDLEQYLIKNGYKAKTHSGTKLAVYVNVYDLVCPYHAQFKKDIAAYKGTPAWTKKYTFAENKVSKNGSNEAFKTLDEAKEKSAFLNYCQVLCIIDFEKKKMLLYQGKIGDSKYLYEFLSAGYN